MGAANFDWSLTKVKKIPRICIHYIATERCLGLGKSRVRDVGFETQFTGKADTKGTRWVVSFGKQVLFS
jgi:hypothetical protein